MKKITTILSVCICVMFIFSSASAGPIVAKIADPTPKTYSYYQALLAMEKEVEAKTGGKVDVQIFGDYSDEPATMDHKNLIFVARK